jgi:NSS family neurotransmitter:Na+ symporter
VIIGIVVIMLITFGIVMGGIKNGLEKANYIFVPGFFLILIGLTIYSVFFLKDGKEGMEVLFDFNFEKINNGKI